MTRNGPREELPEPEGWLVDLRTASKALALNYLLFENCLCQNSLLSSGGESAGWWPGSACPAYLPDSLSGNHQPWWSSRESNPGPVLKCQAKIRPCRVRCGPLCWLPIFPAVIPSAFRALGCVLLPRDSQQCGSLPFPVGGCRRLFSRRDQAATRLREVLPEMKSIFSTLPVMAVGGFKSLPMTGRFSSHQQALSKPIYPKGVPVLSGFRTEGTEPKTPYGPKTGLR